MKFQQKPFPMVWFENEILPLERAQISAISPSARYGLSIFEGIRGYVSQENDGILIFRLQDHLKRFSNSAKIMQLNLGASLDQIQNGVHRVIQANDCKVDSYIRIDGLSTSDGSWNSTQSLKTLIVLQNYDSVQDLNLKSKSACITHYRRIHNSQMPPEVKCGANYINSRYAFFEAQRKGFDYPLMLNLDGYVAESSGACIFMVKNDVLITPPLDAQILASITRDTIIQIADLKDITVEVRNIDFKQLFEADEIFLCGTAAEITPVTRIEGRVIGDGTAGKNTRVLSELYLNVVRNRNLLTPTEWLTLIPFQR